MLAAWERIRRAEVTTYGRLRPRFAAFAEQAASSISCTAKSITAGTYRPDPLHSVKIRKRSGGSRRVVVASVRDQVLERAAVDILDTPVDALLLPVSFAYRKGLGVRDAIEAVLEARDAGAGWFLRTDIQRCFESIPSEAALQDLARGCPDLQWLWILEALAGRTAPGGGHRGGASAGLLQGTPLSPLLSNLYLNRLDRAVIAAGVPLIRYSDDIVIPLFERNDATRALGVVRNVAADQGLSINESKSHLEDVQVGVHFLGQTVTSATETREPVTHPPKATVFVSGPNALLRSKGDRLRVEINGEDRLSLNLLRVRQIVCHGRVGSTTPLLHRAMGLGIDVVFLADSGRYIGRCAATGHIRAGRRRHQYAAADDPERCVDIARSVITGKLTNLRTAVMRWSRHRLLAEAITTVNRIEQSRTKIPDAQSIPEIMGHEGTATAAYFRHFGLLVGKEWGFESRSRRPPRDRVSSMLSFGYALLTMEVIAACEIAGLDPYVGYLHAEGRGRPSLALDLIEEFRCVVVDATVMRLVRTGAITVDDFRVDDERGVLLTDDARRRYFAEYERRMLQMFSHPPSGRRVTYRVALSLQAALLGVAVETGASYMPMVWK